MRGWLVKAVALIAVMVVLTVALSQVSGVVQERQGRMQEAQRNVAADMAGAQWLVGPVLQRHCAEVWEQMEGEAKTAKAVSRKREFDLVSAPQTLSVQGHAAMEPRRRGIYTVNTYLLQSSWSAHWAGTDALQLSREHAGSNLQCGPATVWLAVTDMRGIRKVQLHVQGSELEVQAGTPQGGYPQGWHADLPSLPTGAMQVDVALDVAGSEEIGIAPVGASNEVKLTSDWPHPSFDGRFLPVERSVNDGGFDAAWRVNALASTAHRDVAGGAVVCAGGIPAMTPGAAPVSCIDTFGVRFVEPVDVYVLSDRATKYGVLFVVLTLVAVALTEVMRALRVHPVQYLLVGAALVVFFLLLVSLSEHIPFAWAYAAAAAACTALLSFYASYVLGGARAGLGFGCAIAVLYGALYVLLQMEQSALVLGSLLLFAVLAAVMVATRRVDWYALGQRLAPAEGGQ